MIQLKQNDQGWICNKCGNANSYDCKYCQNCSNQKRIKLKGTLK